MVRTGQPSYFGAGPALLPNEVLKQAAADLFDYQNSGLGLGEISHRSSAAVAVVNDAKDKIRNLLVLPDSHEVFFLQGGGTGQFSAIVYNLLAYYVAKTGKKGKADYFITGSWSEKAAEEAERLGVEVNIVVDSRKFSDGKSYREIPDPENWKFGNPAETAYAYYCDNETVMGVEFPYIPEVPEGVELVADMSSNIFSKEFDVGKFGMIFVSNYYILGVLMLALLTLLIRQELRKMWELLESVFVS